MPETVTMVGRNVLLGCKQLKTVTLSPNLAVVTSGTDALFNGCVALENIYVPDNSPYFKSVDGVLYDLAETIIYCFPPG